MTAKKNNQDMGLGARAPSSALGSRSSQRPRVARTVDAELGRKMRAMYDSLLDQPIPDRFVELLKQLDEAQESKSQ